jgi:hypothetical protein
MKAGYIDEISNWTGLEELSAAYYHAAAARAPKTPRRGYYAPAEAVSSAVDYET